MTDPIPTRRSFRPTSAWLIYGLLVVEGLLWLSERYQCFWFNEKKGWTVLIGVAVVGLAMLVMLLWFIVALVFRWRFQFSIRSLLVLTVAVAVPCSWMAVEMKKAREQNAAVAMVVSSRGWVNYDCQLDAKRTSYLPNGKPPEPAWLRNLLRDDFFAEIIHVYLTDSKITDAQFQQLAGLSKLERLNLTGNHITDAGLGHLKGMPRLQSLNLDRTPITNTGLVQLERLSELQLRFNWLKNARGGCKMRTC